MKRLAITSMMLLACSGAPDGGDGGGDDGGGGDPTVDAGDPAVDPCATPVAVPTTGRALDLMPAERLAELAARMPCVPPGALRDTLESPRTLWYDKHSLTPGYQDSFGDNVVTPIGMRPNTIDPELINLAVPGGHEQIFIELGLFHFPFGNPIGAQEPIHTVNFWRLPDDGGVPVPVVYWQRDPNSYTHRVEWMFPAGTAFGELIFVERGGRLHPVEIRTRTRTLDGWTVDAYRPFPRAADLADAIEQRRAGPASPALDALVAHLRDAGTPVPYTLKATHFASAFPQRASGIDRLPALAGADADVIHTLLRTTPFRSARGVYWKDAGPNKAWAAGASGSGNIVPAGYNAAAVEVSEASCDGCHRDAGRPFKTWYDNILAYGELWGNDETFTWHPFTLSRFVDGNGRVQNFNHDNREIRPDMKAAGLIVKYNPAQHSPAVYQRIVREWTDFRY
ncbi:MAG: hypothetical protein KIT31_21565 [Deltaproteobacteria bacterium]|nr:hypothetical protein [Deltaproteobacteria bacterium]